MLIPIPVGGHFAAELYGDAKKGLKRAGEWSARVVEGFGRERRTLAGFHPDFPHHDRQMTKLVSYDEWHESDADWAAGKGVVYSATYGEIPALWTNPARFGTYEAKLLEYKKNGGQVNRVFVFDKNILDPQACVTLYKVLKRHEKLGLNPRVCSVLKFRSAIKEIDVKSHTVALFNGGTAYFIQSRANGDPIMVRSQDMRLAQKIERALHTRWKESTLAADFLKHCNWEILIEAQNEVERDVQGVENLAFSGSEGLLGGDGI